MLHRFVFVLLIMAAGLLHGADPAEAVRAASNSWRQAVIKQDEAGLKKYLAEDLLYAHSNGRIQNKAEYVAAILKGGSHYESFTDSETVIHVYGKAAMLTGLVDVKIKGRDVYRVRTLEVYVKNGGQWQMAGHQSARITR